MSELEQFKKWAASVDMPDAVLPRAWMAWQASADRAQPAQAGQVLSDERLWEMWVESPSDVLRFGRAIEAAVLAKRVPMTEAQINDAYGAARVQHDHIPHDDVTRIVRAAERHHGIVGKEGGNV